MSMIRVENLSFAYSSDVPVFENINLALDTDWKLGFTGRNGKGKTTFLKLLLGKYEYSGKITSSVQLDYFPFHVSDIGCITYDILADICPLCEEWRIDRELNLLELSHDILERPFNTLSNGEQTKVLLAALFLNDGHFLLIDEPTNHLDIKAREQVSAYLNRKNGFILVSHDRTFLDGCVDHVLALNRTNIEIQSGNFSSWLSEFERRQEAELAHNETLKKDIRHLQQAAKRTADWSDKAEKSKIGTAALDRGYIGHKAAKVMKRSKAMEERQQQAIEEKSGLLRNLEATEDLKLMPLDYFADTLVSYSDVSISYSRQVCEHVTFSVHRGERIALDGKNGSGKSSLLKLILGETIPHTGVIHTGSRLIISYIPQDTAFLRGKLADLAKESGIPETLFKTVLSKLDFGRELFDNDISDFSAGQKKKVLIARSLCEQAHLYIWDEPLNYIDLYSRIQIENLIQQFSPTMIFVEHDRAFREKTATKVVEIKQAFNTSDELQESFVSE